jgi:hypothetical protein
MAVLSVRRAIARSPTAGLRLRAERWQQVQSQHANAARRAGETRDTAELGLIGAYLSDNFVPRNQRVRLFRTWGSGIGMLPAGGTAAWGNASWAPDDTPQMAEHSLTYGCAPRGAPRALARPLRGVPPAVRCYMRSQGVLLPCCCHHVRS